MQSSLSGTYGRTDFLLSHVITCHMLEVLMMTIDNTVPDNDEDILFQNKYT